MAWLLRWGSLQPQIKAGLATAHRRVRWYREIDPHQVLDSVLDSMEHKEGPVGWVDDRSDMLEGLLECLGDLLEE